MTDTTPHIIQQSRDDYAYSVENLARTFGFEDTEELTQWLKEHNDTFIESDDPAHPQHYGTALFHALAEHRTDADGISKQAKEYAQQLFQASAKLSIPLGSYGKQWNDLFLHIAQGYSYEVHDGNAQPQPHPLNPAALELDFTNIGGANIALGRGNTDQAMGIIADIYAATLRDNDINTFTKIRMGGDELRYYLFYENEEQIKKAIKEAREQVREFVKDLKLTNLQHSSYPKRFGFGAGAGYVTFNSMSLNDSQDPAQTLSHQLDQQIKKFKSEEETFFRSATEPFQPVIAATKKKELNPSDNPNWQPAAFQLNESSTGAEDNNNPQALAFLKNNKTYQDLIAQHHGDTYQARIALIDTITGLNEADKALLRDATTLYNSVDPTTGLKDRRGMLETLDYYTQKKNDPNAHPQITIFDTTNIKGLNDLLQSHEATDKVLRAIATSTSTIINEKAQEYHTQDIHLFSLGGGRMCMLSDGLNQEQLKSLCDDVCKNAIQNASFEDGITQEQLQKATNHKRKITNPRTGGSEPEKGVTMLCTSVPLLKEFCKNEHDLYGVPFNRKHLTLLERLSDNFGREPDKLTSFTTVAKKSDAQCLIGNTQTLCTSYAIPEQFINMTLNQHDLEEETVREVVKEKLKFSKYPKATPEQIIGQNYYIGNLHEFVRPRVLH